MTVVPRLVVERRRVLRVEPDGLEQILGAEGAVAVVVDARPGFPIELEERLVTFGGAGGLHHAQQIVGERQRLVER